MKFISSVAMAALVVLAASSAQAVVLAPATMAGNTLDADYSVDGLLSFDMTLRNTNVATFSLQFSSMDLSNPFVSFNAVFSVDPYLNKLTGLKIGYADSNLTAGTARSGFTPGTAGQYAISQAPTGLFNINIPAAQPEYFGVELGAPFSTAGQIDWNISTAGLVAGQTYDLTVQAVPEPSEYLMLLAGLGLVGALARRRRAV